MSWKSAPAHQPLRPRHGSLRVAQRAMGKSGLAHGWREVELILMNFFDHEISTTTQ